MADGRIQISLQVSVGCTETQNRIKESGNSVMKVLVKGCETYGIGEF